MTTDHQAQVEELLADYRRSREQLVSVQRALAAVNASATSQDGLVTATVGAGGTLIGLTIADGAYQQLSPIALARLIVTTTSAAAALAGRSASEVVAPVLPSGTDPEALLRGTADLSAAELAPPVSTAEESFEHRTWMDGGGVRR
jgi:DNA-binding protein YbaB